MLERKEREKIVKIEISVIRWWWRWWWVENKREEKKGMA